jgi:hypothetical protein
MHCVVCNHEKRGEIENALLCRSWGDGSVTLEQISDEFGINKRDLLVHSTMHIPAAQNLEGSEWKSISEKIKYNEAEILRQASTEAFVTMRALGIKINRTINKTEDLSGALTIPQGLISLYLGCASTIRDNTKALVDMNQALNGENNGGLNALAALVQSINAQKTQTKVE